MSSRRPSTRSVSLLAAGIASALVVAGAITPATATPVCPDESSRALCGGRIWAEPGDSIDFVQHNPNEYQDALDALESEHPRFVDVRNLSDYLDDPDAVSVDGHEIPVVRLTDESVSGPKIPIVVSLAVHGVERAGLEGGVRYIEDLAGWADDQPDHILRNGRKKMKGTVGIPAGRVLKKVRIYLAAINPDGWEDGDNENGNVYSRGNGNGVDLNREFPTMGWSHPPYSPLSEPESKAWHRFVKRIDPKAATDLHGELDSANNAFADLMYPAGEWNPREQAQEHLLARHMKSNVARYFEKDGVELEDITGFGGQKPAEYATGYDVVGYDDSGFMGDYFTQGGALEMDVEHFLSHIVPNGNFIPPLEEAHVASVRGEIEALIVEAIVTKRVKVSLRLGRTGYLFDPRRVTSKDGYGGPPPPDAYTPRPYNVSRMKYFRDLSRFARRPLRKVLPADVRRGGLKGLRTFVMADARFPKDPRKLRVRRPASARAVKRFVKRGGNLILTDRAIRLLPRLGILPKKSVKRERHNAGHVNIDDRKDPYVKGVHSTASQTYYEVPLGFPPESTAPHYTVGKEAWEKAGGKTIAHVGDDENRVGLGRVKLGKGTVGIFAAVLPRQTEKYDHFYGLANYGVTVAGGQILNNMIRFGP